MSFIKLNLIAPNNLEIIGVKLIDNSVAEFECSYEKKTNTQHWIVPKNIIENNNCFIFIDKAGDEWQLNQNDVVFNTITKNILRD